MDRSDMTPTEQQLSHASPEAYANLLASYRIAEALSDVAVELAAIRDELKLARSGDRVCQPMCITIVGGNDGEEPS